DYDADTVLRQTQAAGQWCDAVLAQVTQHEGFENVTALLESLRSQLAKAVAEMLDRRRLFDSDDAPLGIDGFRGKVYNTIKRLLNRPSELKGDGHGQRRLPASGRLLRYVWSLVRGSTRRAAGPAAGGGRPVGAVQSTGQ